MKIALIWLAIVVVFAIAMDMFDKHPTREHVGRAVACSERFPFQKYSQAEILEYGLEDVRGLASDRQGTRIFIAEGNRSLLIDWLDSTPASNGKPAELPVFQDAESHTTCPDEPCGADDPRGLAILDGRLFSAEHGSGQITVRNLPPSRFKPQGPGKPSQGAAWLNSAETQDILTQPSGIAAVDHTLFVTGGPLRSVSTSQDNSDDSADHMGDPEKAKAQPSGELYVCAADQCEPKTITASLRHPSGVAAQRADGPIFVAETDAHEVRWPVFEKKNDGKWTETRSLGSAPISGDEVLSSFLGIALDESQQMVFAAGPGGLYVFDLNGGLLGRVVFDEPVSGVATGGDHVYLAVGHTLCALTLDHSSRLSNEPRIAAPEISPRVIALVNPNPSTTNPPKPSPKSSGFKTPHSSEPASENMPHLPRVPSHQTPESSGFKIPHSSEPASENTLHLPRVPSHQKESEGGVKQPSCDCKK